jgi:hypothetical protein
MVAIPFQSLVLADNGGKIKLPGATQEALKNLPEFKYRLAPGAEPASAASAPSIWRASGASPASIASRICLGEPRAPRLSSIRAQCASTVQPSAELVSSLGLHREGLVVISPDDRRCQMRSTVSITIVEDMIGTGETLSHASWRAGKAERGRSLRQSLTGFSTRARKRR